MRLSAAIRTRSDGAWHGGSHYGKLEIGREVMNSLTKVSKDTLVIEVNELDTVRPETDERRDRLTPPHPHKDGEAVSNTLISTLYKNPPHVVTPYDCDKRPKEEPQGGEITPHDDPDHTGDRLQESATRHWCLRYARSEEMKARRRLVGDNGGIKFQGKIAVVRDDRCVNTITAVLKDNLILCARQI